MHPASHRPRHPMRRFVPLSISLAFAIACAPAHARTTPQAPAYTLEAIRFGTLVQFPMRALVMGGDSTKKMDGAFMVWALRRADGTAVLVDAGFHREKFVRQWKPGDYSLPSEAVRRAGIPPEKVTDIVVSHIHWDHADGVDLFPAATIWLQREEFDYYVGPKGEALKPAIDAEVAAMYRKLFDEGRVKLVDGDDKEILPGIRVYTGGKHTWASQFVSAQIAGGKTAIVASDNAYLYVNLRDKRPIAQTLDSLSNLRAQARMLQLASESRLVVPGHDPQVFTNFPTPGNGVARVQ